MSNNWPQWLKDAHTENVIVEIANGVVVWEGGTWHGGVWKGGTWERGVWHDGVWKGGTWKDGTWQGGVWNDTIERIPYMLALMGIYKEQGLYTGYRSVTHDKRGRFTKDFVQKTGRVGVRYDPRPGVCNEGLHVGSIKTAFLYFGRDDTAKLVRVIFADDDILGFDHEKVRLKGGVCEFIPWPWENK